jgi:rhodanese-related sulfurtransferase
MIKEHGTVTERRTRLLPLISVALTGLLVGRGEGTSESVSDATTVSGFSMNDDGYVDISVEELAGLLESEQVTLVNARIPYEGELPETDLFIPYDEVADHLDQLPDKDAPVVLYRRSGSMSTSAAQQIAALGHTSALEVDGGFNAWKAAGYDLLSE